RRGVISEEGERKRERGREEERKRERKRGREGGEVMNWWIRNHYDERRTCTVRPEEPGLGS
ncbi:MAG TPA: hypothetical protein PLY76_02185, partial [Flavobacteriales bacterium]|nr:hypothetical protein [Flavobacteriales bacterium]